MKLQWQPADWFERAANVCGAATVSIGVLALAGWVTGLRELATVNNRWIPMAPNAALAFIALGAALVLVQHGGRRSLVVAKLLGAAVVAVVLARLSESATGADLGVDRWIFNMPAESLGLIPVGKMAFVTALNFLYVGVALLLIAFNRWRLVAEVLAVVVAFVGVVFFLGYLYQAPLLYRGSMIPMAITTAAAFCFLGAGTLIVVAGRDLGVRRRAAQQLRLQAAALNAAATSILITDRRGAILWCNPAFAEMTGYTAAEAIGQNSRILKSGKHDVRSTSTFGEESLPEESGTAKSSTNARTATSTRRRSPSHPCATRAARSRTSLPSSRTSRCANAPRRNSAGRATPPRPPTAPRASSWPT